MTGKRQQGRRLTAEDHAEIVRLLSTTTLAQQQIADRVGVNRKSVAKIMSGDGQHGDGQRVQRPDGAKQRPEIPEATAIEVRRLLADTTLTQAAIAEQVGISVRSVSSIGSGRSWGHLGPPPQRPSGARRIASVTEAQVHEIRRLLTDTTLTQAAIADQVGVSEPCVGGIRSGRAWRKLGPVIRPDDDPTSVLERWRTRISRVDQATGDALSGRRLAEAQAVEVRRLLTDTTLTHVAIADQVGASIQQVANIKAGRTWATLGPPPVRPTGALRGPVVTEATAIEVRRLLTDTTLTQQQIADQIGVGLNTVSSIAQGKAWHQLGGPISRPRRSDPEKRRKAVEVRRLLADTTLTQPQIADQIGVNSSLVARILHGEAWTELGPAPQRPESARRRPAITEEQVLEIRRLLTDSELTQTQIADRVGVTFTIVKNIARGRTWTRFGPRPRRRAR